jgi:hypothetical protein|tara:strand:- start:6295 stop:6963 length:669 start_codon:yes stop_codon:yes gene_type:complete
MTMNFSPPNLIGAQSAHVGANPFLDRFSSARAAGTVIQYEYKNLKPKKQLKEIIKILMPEKKKLLKIPYRFKYNLKDRCVVCGSQKIWESGDSMRPPLPLHKVRKGYPMRGTYCNKHAAIHRQYEMLEQQILAEEHGLSFSAYIPSAKSLNPLSSNPLTSLKQVDIQSLSSLGWTVRPPTMGIESKEEELFRLIIETNGINERVKTLLTEGVNVVNVETGGE